jgi:hypothetical protein
LGVGPFSLILLVGGFCGFGETQKRLYTFPFRCKTESLRSTIPGSNGCRPISGFMIANQLIVALSSSKTSLAFLHRRLCDDN